MHKNYQMPKPCYVTYKHAEKQVNEKDVDNNSDI